MTQNNNHDNKSSHSTGAAGDMPTLWLIDDDAALRLVLADTFTDANLNVVSFTQAQAAWTRLNDILATREPATNLPDVILTDIRMPMMDGLSFSDWVHQHFPELPIIIMTAHSDLTSAINSYQTGAFEYLPKPFDLDDAVATIYKALGQPQNETSDTLLAYSETGKPSAEAAKQQKTTDKAAASPTPQINKPAAVQTPKIVQETPTNNNPSGIIGQSQAMQTVFRAIGRLAQSPITVLITGESGTGKELVAGALHEHSPRAQQPFIALNMAAIPHDLIESELFGHEKGAFTGATTQRAGRFEQADGGTLFLDEIGDMPFSTQTRLLRVLANGEFYRVGGQKPVKVDVRIIAATHQNLEHLVSQGKFREDLFYRLNVIRMPLPPLRERPEDIPALATFFMKRAAEQMNTAIKQLHPDAMLVMQGFEWRGNVRQLENVCLWLTVMTTGDTVLVEDLPPELLANIDLHNVAIEQRSITHAEAAASQSARAASNPISDNDDINQSANTYGLQANITNWQQPLAIWAQQALKNGEYDILQTATPEFERILLMAALNHSDGKKIAAAHLLGWGRNTLTRKLKQLDISLQTHTKD